MNQYMAFMNSHAFRKNPFIVRCVIYYMNILKACVVVIVVLTLIQHVSFLPMTRIPETPVIVEEIKICYELRCFLGNDKKSYTITRENEGYVSDAGKNVDPELIKNLMAGLTDFYQVEIPELYYNDYITPGYYPSFKVTITSTEGEIAVYSDSSFHCFIPWNTTYYRKRFVQFNGKIPSALLKILVDLDDCWHYYDFIDYDKIARQGCYSPLLPEEYVDKDLSFYFPQSSPAPSLESEIGAHHLEWRRDVGYLTEEPLLVDEFIFVVSPENVTCIDSKTGKVMWDYTANRGIPSSYLSHQYIQYVDGNLIVAKENGLTCLDCKSGAVIWDINTLPVAHAPVYYAGSLFLGVERDTVVDLLCIDVKTGETVWKFAVDEDGYTPSDHCDILVENGVYFVMGEQVIFRLDEETGDVIWEYHDGGRELSELYATSRNRLIVADAFGHGALCLDTETGRKAWESPEECRALIYNDAVFLRCYDPDNGTGTWLVDSYSGDIIYGDGDCRKISVCYYQDGILCLELVDTGTVTAFDTRSMTELWQYTPVSPRSRIRVLPQGVLISSIAHPEETVWYTDEMVLFDSEKNVLWEHHFSEPDSRFIEFDAYIFHGILFVFEEKGIIEAFDMKGGRLWKTEIRANGITGFTVYENQLYVCANDGMVYCFDPMTGSILWNHDTGVQVIGPEDREGLYILGIEGNLMVVYSELGTIIAYSI
jgi:outer membrane protein assembly factor BamB